MNMKNYLRWMLVVGVIVSGVDLYAGSGKRKGTAGAQELLIPVGGLGIGLSGALTSSARGVEAIFWNPAGIANLTGSAEAMFSHMNYIADINVEYAAVATKLGEAGTVAFSIRSMNFGDIPVTTVDQPDGTGETYSPTFLTLGLSYSRSMTDRIMFGATAKLVSEQIVRESATGVAFDFGLQYQTAQRGLKFGVALKNLGPNMKFDGPDLESTVQIPGTEPGTQPRPLRLTSESFELPSTLEMGASYDLEFGDNASLMLTGAFEHHNFSNDDFKGGVELSYDKTLFVRGGYILSPDTPEDDVIYTYSAGVGVNLQLASNINVAVDYAYRAAKLFGANQVFSVKLGL
ncbi:MAG: PorV/PorQ family protein [bacterium]